MGNIKAYKKMFINAKCDYCGKKEFAADRAIVYDAIQKLKMCKSCYELFCRDHQLPKWDKLGDC